VARQLFPGSAWAIIFFALAAAVLLNELPPERVWPAAALLLGGVLIVTVPREGWRHFLGSIQKAQLGPVSVDLRREAREAAAHVPAVDTGEGPGAALTGDPETMFDLRIRLEYKLTYAAKHLLAPGQDNATFLTIGSLKLDGYLTPAEARTAIGILATRQRELEDLPPAARKRFLEEAGEFVGGVRASIFWGQVKRRLKGKDGDRGNLLEGEISGSGRRKDLQARSSDELVRVIPALALDPDSKILAQTVERVRRESEKKRTRLRPLIVIPDVSAEANLRAEEGRPEVVKLASLRSVLGGA
jgi:hypothetical protein